MPARADLLYLVRFHVGAAAAYADMTLEAVEDLQLAVDELCLSLLKGRLEPADRLSVRIDWTPKMVEVVCTVTDEDDLQRPSVLINGSVPHRSLTSTALPADLSDKVLDALVDEHGTFSRSGRDGAWLRKRPVAGRSL